MSLFLICSVQLSYARPSKKYDQKDLIIARVLLGVTGLVLSGVAIKMIKENIYNRLDYRAKRSALEKKYKVHIKDRIETQYAWGYGSYTIIEKHSIYLEAYPLLQSAEEYNEFEKEWATIKKLHSFDNGSDRFLHWIIGGAVICLLAAFEPLQ